MLFHLLKIHFIDCDPTFDYKKAKFDVHEDDDVSATRQGTTGKNRKTRWSIEENKIFGQIFKNCIIDKILPNSKLLEQAANKLPGRARLAIRSKVHNIISGKQKFNFPKN